MSAAIVNRLDAVMRRLRLTDRAIYKRVHSRTGGDPLIGSSGTESYLDTLLDPQPKLSLAGRSERVLGGSEKVVQDADYALLVSPSAMTVGDFQNKDVTLVLKDAAGKEEELQILSVGSTVVFGGVVAFKVLAKGRKR